jgi:hypothetical protein
VGYALGGKVGLMTAALDERIHAIASIAAFTPLRTSANNGTEGVWHYSHLHGLMPRLGFFIGNEQELPFDYDEILSACSTPVLIVAPELDRYADIRDVRRAVSGKPHVTLKVPRDFNRFGPTTQEEVFSWLEKNRN